MRHGRVHPWKIFVIGLIIADERRSIVRSDITPGATWFTGAPVRRIWERVAPAQSPFRSRRVSGHRDLEVPSRTASDERQTTRWRAAETGQTLSVEALGQDLRLLGVEFGLGDGALVLQRGERRQLVG
jgi:hypothetical protein